MTQDNATPPVAPVPPTPLSYGDKVHFVASTPRWGTAEFHFCHQFTRGKMRRVYITRGQQPGVHPREYTIECRGSDFSIHSWTHKGIELPRIWLQYWCKDHKAVCLRAYIPRNANYFQVFGNQIVFDKE